MAKKVLIVDDSLFMRMMIRDVALESGWQIAGEAEDGLQAIELFQQTRPDLVTLDLVMPKMGGLDTLAALRNLDPDAKVVVISAMDQKQTLINAIRGGATDFVVKPFERERFAGVLAKLGA